MRGHMEPCYPYEHIPKTVHVINKLKFIDEVSLLKMLARSLE